MIVPTYLMDENQGRLYADAVTSLTPTWNANATKYPVSDKSTVTLNVVRQNPVLNLTMYVGRHPIKKYDGLVGYENLNQRPSIFHDVLLNWYNNSTKLTIVNELYNFSNYVITSYSPRQVGTTDSYEYSLTLEHIRHVSYTRGTLIQAMDESKQIDAQTKTSQSDSNKSQANTQKSMSRQVWEIYNENGVVDLQNP